MSLSIDLQQNAVRCSLESHKLLVASVFVEYLSNESARAVIHDLALSWLLDFPPPPEESLLKPQAVRLNYLQSILIGLAVFLKKPTINNNKKCH